MDKYEYKVRADEIKQLIANGEYAEAAEIADTIDWRRVKSVMMLCTVSDLYKINRRFEDARDLLLLAYEQRPGGRTICYSLCELSIKMEEFVQAVEFYKEFVQVAPKDPGRYVLQYKLYEAQDVSLEERIEVLEELKKRDYREKWAYELAYLYHRVGLATRCVEECDELILWFGAGKYVIKAMELKMLHQPLTEEQQEKYDHRFDEPVTEEPAAEKPAVEAVEAAAEPAENVGQETQVYQPVHTEEEPDIHVKTMDVGQYNTINLQAELAVGLREVLGEENKAVTDDPITNALVEPLMHGDTGVINMEAPVQEENVEDVQPETISEEEVAEDTSEEAAAADEADTVAEAETEEVEPTVDIPADAEDEDIEVEEVVEADNVPDITAEMVMEQMRIEVVAPGMDPTLAVQPPRELANVLSQESDGQIRLVMPESENLEKQITGQMSIEDILAEWERMKKENEEKRKEDVRLHVLEQTGSMFTEFEAAKRDGLLEKLESGEITLEDAVEESEELVEETVEAEVTEESVEEPEAEAEAELAEESAEEDPIEEADEVEELEEIAEETETEELEEESEEEVEEEAVEDSTEEPVAEEEETIEEGAEELEVELEEKSKKSQIEREPAKLRTLTPEEKELYAPYIQSRNSRDQLIQAIDNITLASYTGNVMITGDEGMDLMGLAKSIVREIQMTDSNFSGKVAKISGGGLNKKDVEATINPLENGSLIIEKASEMDDNTVKELYKCLQRDNFGVIVFLVDVKRAMKKFLDRHTKLQELFTACIEVEALSNDALVTFGKNYAHGLEYAIDDLGMLALHTRIEELQTSDHAVTTLEVKEIVDAAIDHVNRKTVTHFFDILFAKRYDEEDMIVLSEKDFA